jgi:hypothetical protein
VCKSVIRWLCIAVANPRIATHKKVKFFIL